MSLRRVLKLIREGAPGLALTHLALILVSGVLPLVQLYLMKLIVDRVVLSISAADKATAMMDVYVVIIIAGLTYLVGSIIDSVSAYIKQAHIQSLTDYLQQIIHSRSIAADLAYYEDARYFDNLHRAQREAAFRPASLINSLESIFQSGVTVIAISGLLFSLHWAVMLVLLAAVLPTALIRMKFSMINYDWQWKRTSTERLARYFSWMMTMYQYAKEIRIFNLGESFNERFRELRKTLREEKMQIARRRSTGEAFTQFISAIAVFGSYTFIAVRTIQGVITLGGLVMYFQAFQRGMSAIKGVLSGMNNLYENNLFLNNLYEFLDLKPLIDDPTNPQPAPRPMKTGLRVSNVSFKYSDAKKDALRNIDLEIKPGEIIALVGENGSGKTTLVKLLCRLYDPQEGSVSIDGQDVRSFRVTDLRSQIGVIFQDYTHYQLTVRENITLTEKDIEADTARAQEAARYVGIDDFIKKMPLGYETTLGRWFENGVELSIGEWQKIALARAFARDSQVIVLDEPTSSLDPEAEFRVFEQMRGLLKGRSGVLISHRFSAVRSADRIYVFDAGQVIEQGTHAELLAAGGKYARMFESQAQFYR